VAGLAENEVHATVDEHSQHRQGPPAQPTDDLLAGIHGEDDLESEYPDLETPTLRDNIAEAWHRLPGVGRVGVVTMAFLLVVLACTVLAASLGELTATVHAPPIVTNTPTQRPSPTSTQSPEAALATLVQTAIGPTTALSVRADIDPTYTVIGVIVTVGEQPDLLSAQETVKAVVFTAQSAIWQAGYAPGSVVVTVLGPNFHSGVISTGEYGEAKLNAATAGQFDWPSLTPDIAWKLYDSVALLGTGAKTTI
jgi:hypothetical protein